MRFSIFFLSSNNSLLSFLGYFLFFLFCFVFPFPQISMFNIMSKVSNSIIFCFLTFFSKTCFEFSSYLDPQISFWTQETCVHVYAFIHMHTSL